LLVGMCFSFFKS